MKKITKRLTAFLVCMCCVFQIVGNAQAMDNVQEIIQYDDGTYAEITLTQSNMTSRSATKTGSKTYIYKDSSGNVLFTYTLKGSFQYDGSTSKALTCSTGYSIMKSGWSKKSDSCYCSGNKAYGTAKFANSSTSKTVNLTITCSKNGTFS